MYKLTLIAILITTFFETFSQEKPPHYSINKLSPLASFTSSNISITHRQKPTIAFLRDETSKMITLKLNGVSIFLHRMGSTLNDEIVLHFVDTSVALKNMKEIKDSMFYFSFETTITEHLLKKIINFHIKEITIIIPPSPTYKEMIEKENYFSDNPRMRKDVIKSTEKTAVIKLKKINREEWNILSEWVKKNF